MPYDNTEHINDNILSTTLLGADEAVISFGPPGSDDNDKFYVVGVTQQFSTGSGRRITPFGGIGSNGTILGLGEVNISGQMQRLFIKNRSLLYAAYYSQYGTIENEFPKLSEFGSENADDLIEDITSTDMHGGDDHLVAVVSDDATSLNVDNLDIIALLQGSSVNSTLTVERKYELGSTKPYLLAGRGTKTMSIPRAKAESGSLLYALYKDKQTDLNLTKPVDTMWDSLNYPLFSEPITIADVVLDNEGNILSAHKKQRALVSAIGSNFQENTKAIDENVTLTWEKTKYLSGGTTGDTNSAPDDLANSNDWIDLDRAIFRKPFNMKLSYFSVNNEGIRTLAAQMRLEDVYFTRIANSYAAGNRSSIEQAEMQISNMVTESISS